MHFVVAVVVQHFSDLSAAAVVVQHFSDLSAAVAVEYHEYN